MTRPHLDRLVLAGSPRASLPHGSTSGLWTRLSFPGLEGVIAGCAWATSALAEIVFWQTKGDHLQFWPLVGYGLLLSVGCGLLVSLSGFLGRWRRPVSVALLAVVLWPFAEHAVEYVLWDWSQKPLLTLIVTLIVAAVTRLVGERRAGAVLLVSSVVVFAGVAVLNRRAARDLGPRAARGAHPDIVLIVMDTTRRDRLGLYGHRAGTTPNLDALAASSQVFDQAWSTAPWTPPGHASLMTGLWPSEHGVDGQTFPPYRPPHKSLPEVLRKVGYRTGAAVANPMLTAPGWERGFDEYLTFWSRSQHTLVPLLNKLRFGVDHFSEVYGFRAPRTLRLAEDWWERAADAPRFLFVNVLDPHRPYSPPEDYYERFLPDVDPEAAYAVPQHPEPYHLRPGISAKDQDILSRLYDAELAYLDAKLGDFLDRLQEQGDLDRSIVVITSDHGERLGERGLTGHDVMMDPFLLRVPLIVRYPDHVPPGRTDELVQLTGVPGYILDLVGIEAPEPMGSRALNRSSLGRVIAQNQEPVWFLDRVLQRDPAFDVEPYLGDWTFVTDGEFAWISSSLERSQPGGLFDIRNDPELTKDLSVALPDQVRRLSQGALELPGYAAVAQEDIPDRVLEQLRAFGYVGEATGPSTSGQAR